MILQATADKNKETIYIIYRSFSYNFLVLQFFFNSVKSIVTILSAFLNAKDNNGVLECKWPGTNEDGNNYEADPYAGGYN